METAESSRPRKPRRSWWQYSVSTLLIVMAVICVLLALVVGPAERQRRAVAALKDLNVQTTYDFESEGRAPPGPGWLRRILGVDYFAEVADSPYHWYRPGDMPIQASDEACVHLGVLTTLRTLHLSATGISDVGLAHLNRLTSLKKLAVDNNMGVTDAGLAQIAGLTSLVELRLGRTQITDAGLAHLAGLTSLETLSLFGTGVTDAGLIHLEKLTNLKQLDLSGTWVTREGCDKLQSALPNCRLQLF